MLLASVNQTVHQTDTLMLKFLPKPCRVFFFYFFQSAIKLLLLSKMLFKVLHLYETHWTTGLVLNVGSEL